MKMTFQELRRDPGKLLKAIEANEEVLLSKKGKVMARISPTTEVTTKKASVAEHSAFGMWADHEEMSDPVGHVRSIRKGRNSCRSASAPQSA